MWHPNDFLWVNLERTLDKRCRKVGVATRWQVRKGHQFAEGQWLKKVVRFFRKKLHKVTPSLAAPGDINLSDAIDSTSSLLKLTTATAGGSSSAVELHGWPALFPCPCRMVNRSVWIVRLWSASVHGVWQRSTFAVHSNTLSWLCSYSMSECFSVLIDK